MEEENSLGKVRMISFVLEVKEGVEEEYMLFYDFEVFKEDWLVVIMDSESKETHIIVNDEETLKNFYDQNKEEIWCGYNSRRYDQYILKGIICGFNPKEINDFIIVKKQGGWDFSNLFQRIQLYNYDVMTSRHGLKQLEGFMGNDIRETTVPFNIDRKLTKEELEEVIKYCSHDVEQTIEVFINRLEEFQSHMSLIKAFKLPIRFISKTKAQLAAIILEARRSERKDEFNISIVDTIKIKRYHHIVQWYKDPINRNYEKYLEVEVAGVPHVFGWGGLHGAIPKYKGEGIFINSDVASFYPALMIEYDFLSRNVREKSSYRAIRDKRIEFKKNKDPMQQPYKIVLNSVYGASKDKYNDLYDPLQANNVCVNGQLLLLDLIEKLEDKFLLIQANTDGLIFKLEREGDIPLYKKICREWEERTFMTLEHEIINKIVQKDVNNYLIVQEEKVKSKGAYVKELTNLDYDLPIVNRALIEYFTKGTPVEKTILGCKSLKEFQKIVKVSYKYLYAMHGEKKLNEKVLRVFASKDHDSGVFKVKGNGRLEKIANTPESCYIVNDNVANRRIARKLDRQWYIKLAQKRIIDFIGEK